MNLLENLKPKRFSLSREIPAISGRHLSLPNRSALSNHAAVPRMDLDILTRVISAVKVIRIGEAYG